MGPAAAPIFLTAWGIGFTGGTARFISGVVTDNNYVPSYLDDVCRSEKVV